MLLAQRNSEMLEHQDKLRGTWVSWVKVQKGVEMAGNSPVYSHRLEITPPRS